MGDVLAGILTALLGQGLTPEDAMKLGVYLHGLVGDTGGFESWQIGLIASDIIDGLPPAMRKSRTRRCARIPDDRLRCGARSIR